MRCCEIHNVMKIDCPHGYKAVLDLGKDTTLEDSSVTILGGVCECAHQCAISTCKFYDISQAADARFIAALRRSHTLEGLLEARRKH
jgi:hypothetical protein